MFVSCEQPPFSVNGEIFTGKEQEESLCLGFSAPCGSSQLCFANYMFAPMGGKVLIH